MSARLPCWPTVVHMLADAARLNPTTTAIVCGDVRLDYQSYVSCVSGLAAALTSEGVRPGERVAVVLSNSADIAIATFGVQACGAQLVPLNPAYTSSELGPILNDADCAAIIYDATSEAALGSVLHRFAPNRRFHVGEHSEGLRLWGTDQALISALPLPDPDSLSTLQYTGGTTGRAKGVNLTHRSIALNIAQRESLLPTNKGAERVLAITPLFHIYAVAMGLYLAANARSTLVIMDRYHPERVLETIARERITLMAGSPTIFVGLMSAQTFSAADMSSLRLCYSGSSALSVETLQRWESATGCPICEGYGQSESGPVLTFNPVKGPRKVGSVGIVTPGTEIEIVDPESGSVRSGPGQMGEIRARGAQVMLGYRNLPEETAQALRDGWLYTGDIGELDAEGYLYIRDRKKEMAIIGGYNVYPREVEEVLFAHPDVVEAAVVSVPDAYRGEQLIAWICPARQALTSDELLKHLESRLVRYKIPRQFRFLGAMPRTSVGKIDKVRLKAQAQESA